MDAIDKILDESKAPLWEKNVKFRSVAMVTAAIVAGIVYGLQVAGILE